MILKTTLSTSACQPFDPGAREEIRDRRRKQRANLGFAALHVDADGAGKHQGNLYILVQHLAGVLGVANLDDLKRLVETPSLPGSRPHRVCAGLGNPSLPTFSRSPKPLLLQKGFSVVTVCSKAFMSSSHRWVVEGGILLPCGFPDGGSNNVTVPSAIAIADRSPPQAQADHDQSGGEVVESRDR